MKKIICFAFIAALSLSLAVSVCLPAVAKASPKLSKTKVTLYADSSIQKTKTIKVKNEKKVKWSTSNKKVVTVSRGKLTARKKGSATVTATVSERKLKCRVTVKNVALSKNSIFLTVGKTNTIKLNGETIKSVKSSNTKIATITKKGVIKGIKTGSATMIITGNNKKKYTLKVTVKSKAYTSVIISGKCGNSSTYKLTNDGKLSISGRGKMYNYKYNNQPWFNHKNEIKKTVITQNITHIGNNSFYECTGMTAITIPDSVTSIGDSAFDGCTSLPSVIIPHSVISIGVEAFSGCSMKSITIPDSVASIGNFAFAVSSFTSVTVPGSIKTGYDPFYGCMSLKKITFTGKSITESAQSLMGSIKSRIQNIAISNSITSIGYLAFDGCTGLTSVTIPDSVTSIGSMAFNGCTNLKSASIANSVTAIGDNAFSECTSLTDLTIPDSVTSIGDSAFVGCIALTSIAIPVFMTSIKEATFSGCSGLKNVVIPDSVTSIEVGAFYGCKGLKSITIPDSVTSIGEEAFAGCTGLTIIYYSGPATDDAQWGAPNAKVISK